MSSNKYLIFSVLHETYGLPIEKIQEIIRYEAITPVHDSLEYIKGVINLRGKIIPVFDLKLKFGMDHREYNEQTVLIIADIISPTSEYNVALAVDGVHAVTIINSDDIKDPPQMGLKVRSQYLRGIVRYKEQMVMLLNIDEIIKEDAVLQLTEESYDKSSDS